MSTMVIKIPRTKVEDMSECVEKMLRYGGKIMQCLDDLQNDEGMMGERGGRMGYRNNYDYRFPTPMGRRGGGRMGYREDDDDDWEDEERGMMMRRGRY